MNPFPDPRIYYMLLLQLLKMVAGTWILMLPLAFGIYYGIIWLGKKSIKMLYIKAYLSIIGLVLATLPETFLFIDILFFRPGNSYRPLVVASFRNAMAC